MLKFIERINRYTEDYLKYMLNFDNHYKNLLKWNEFIDDPFGTKRKKFNEYIKRKDAILSKYYDIKPAKYNWKILIPKEGLSDKDK